MFENAPIEVALKLRRLCASRRVDGDSHYLAAAIGLIEHYLGLNLPLSSQDDPLFRKSYRLENGRHWQYSARILQIGQTLFELRNDPGFYEFCRRLGQNRNLLSTYIEVCAAAMLKLHGFSISARPERGVKTQDFDFSVQIESETANVEVVSIRRNVFEPRALISRLNDKKKQLAPHQAGIIFCMMPNEYWKNQDFIDQVVKACQRFYNQSSRVNAVFLARECWIDIKELGGYVYLSGISVINATARHPSPLVAKALLTKPDAHERVEALENRNSNVVLDGGTGSFFDWVDTLTVAPW